MNMNSVITIYILVLIKDGNNNIENEISEEFANKIIDSGVGKITNGKLVGDSVNIMYVEVQIK